MRSPLKLLTLATLITVFGDDATAQQAPAAPRGPMAGPMAPRAGGGVSAMLNARRALDLTPRQVAQLDSIERGLHAERQRVTAAMRPAMDSLRQQRARGDGPPRDEAQRRAMREQADQRREAMRPQMEQLRQRDSAATVAAERLLTDAQRAKWRELQAERRGFQRGMQAGRGERRGEARGPGGGRANAPRGRPGQGGGVPPR